MRGNLVVLPALMGSFSFDVKLAVAPKGRVKGLIYRQELASSACMLFDFGSEQEVAFWMQNTLIPPDMIFLAADGTVGRILENALPMDTTLIPSCSLVCFVLEIAGGRSDEIEPRVGDNMETEAVSARGQQSSVERASCRPVTAGSCVAL